MVFHGTDVSHSVHLMRVSTFLPEFDVVTIFYFSHSNKCAVIFSDISSNTDVNFLET